MKILHINSVYGNGSTGRIVADLVREASKMGNDSMALYGRFPISSANNAIKVSTEWEAKIHSLISRYTGQQFSYSPIATLRVIKFIESYNPDVVHLHCLNGNFINVYKLMDYLKNHGIRTVLTLHAEIMHTAGCEHAYDCELWMSECSNCPRVSGKITRFFRDDANFAFRKMRKAFARFDNLTIVGVSDWLTQRAKKSGVFSECNARFSTVYNGCDLSAFKPSPKKENVRKKILHVTPNFNHPLKGGKYVIQLAKEHPEWNFYVAGHDGSDIEDKPRNINFLGKISNKYDLAKFYSASDVTLLTSKRETFSMVCLESLCCGTPVIGFQAGGPESVFTMEGAIFVPQGDFRALANAIRSTFTTSPVIDSELLKSQFSAKQMFQKYYQLYL